MLIALDDLHWVDTPTLDLVAHLVDALDTASLRHGARALIVATSRPEPGGPTAIALERLARTGIGRRIDVGGLDRGEVAELISTLGLQVPSRQAVDAVVRLTRGNPLAVEGVARQVRLGELTDLDRIGQLALPIELEDHATRRVAELPAPARTILTMAALLDRSVNTEELARLGSFDVAAVVEARDLGITHGVLAAAGDIVRFAHALFSRALVQSLPASTRQQFHAELAARLEEDPDSAVAEIAHHLLAAGPGVPAVTIHRGLRGGGRAGVDTGCVARRGPRLRGRSRRRRSDGAAARRSRSPLDEGGAGGDAVPRHARSGRALRPFHAAARRGRRSRGHRRSARRACPARQPVRRHRDERRAAHGRHRPPRARVRWQRGQGTRAARGSPLGAGPDRRKPADRGAGHRGRRAGQRSRCHRPRARRDRHESPRAA